MISSIPTKDFVNTNKQFHQYRKTILSIPVNNFINTSKRFLPYQQRYIFNDLSKFDVEIEDFKNINRNMPRYRIKNKRIHILIWPQKCPIKVSASTDARTPVSPPPVPYIPCGAERGGHQKSKVLSSSGISFLSFSFSCKYGKSNFGSPAPDRPCCVPHRLVKIHI